MDPCKYLKDQNFNLIIFRTVPYQNMTDTMRRFTIQFEVWEVVNYSTPSKESSLILLSLIVVAIFN